MACEEMELGTEPSALQVGAFADASEYLSFNMDGIDFDIALETLTEEEACVASTDCFDLFYEGQMIGPAVLSLKNEDPLIVYPVVKAKNWPLIQVEFLQISEKDRRTIGRSLAAAAGGRRPPAYRRKYLAMFP
jgi:hypothetical protein